MESLTKYFAKVLPSFTAQSESDAGKAVPEKLLADPDSGSPDKAWQKRRKHQKCVKVEPLDPKTPVKKNHLRFVCISDTHTHLEKRWALHIPAGDVLLHAGDFTMTGLPEEVDVVNKYLNSLPHKIKIIIAGNHDNSFDLEFIAKKRSTRIWSLNDWNYEKYLEERGVKTVHELLTNCIYLQDSSVEICGIKIYGSPWTPGHGSWGFQRPRGWPLLKKWNAIPSDTDILLTHCPPCGYGDGTADERNPLLKLAGFRGDHVGCVDLLNTVQRRVQPKYHIFGHIHEGYGVRTDGKTTFINAATCTKSYQPINQPFVFDFPIPEGYSRASLDEMDVSAYKWNNVSKNEHPQGASANHNHDTEDTDDEGNNDDDDDDMDVDEGDSDGMQGSQDEEMSADDFFHLDRNVENVDQTNYAKLGGGVGEHLEENEEDDVVQFDENL